MSEIETRSLTPRHADRADLPLTVISDGDVLYGRLEMVGNGQVQGRFDGELSCAGELMIGPQAQVRANILAHNLLIAGRVTGNVIVQGRLKITTSGRLEGDAQVGSLVVQEG